MRNVTFAVEVKHWCISLLIVVLVNYFGLILLLGGIVEITRESGSNSVIFYMHFIPENTESFLGINYCLLAPRNYFYISAKNKASFLFSFLTRFVRKQARDRQ